MDEIVVSPIDLVINCHKETKRIQPKCLNKIEDYNTTSKRASPIFSLRQSAHLGKKRNVKRRTEEAKGRERVNSDTFPRKSTNCCGVFSWNIFSQRYLAIFVFMGFSNSVQLWIHWVLSFQFLHIKFLFFIIHFSIILLGFRKSRV